MNGQFLARDYLQRANNRFRALETLFQTGSWADVVRESQEIFELCTKGALRFVGIDPPRIHDLGPFLEETQERFPPFWREAIPFLCELSAFLSEERSESFYGNEVDWVPASELYSQEEAQKALDGVQKVIALLERLLGTHQP